MHAYVTLEETKWGGRPLFLNIADILSSNPSKLHDYDSSIAYQECTHLPEA